MLARTVFEVALPAEGLTFVGRCGESILEALRSVHHRAIDAGCHNGGCGVCKVRILSGQCRMGAMSAVHVGATDRREGRVLACRAYPITDVAVEVLGKLPSRMIRQYGFLATNENRREDGQ